MSNQPDPWDHQLEALAKAASAPGGGRAFALFMEQRTGKTRVALLRARDLFHHDEIRALVVVAPNGVHRNWVTDELPQWAEFDYRAHAWRSDKAKTADDREHLRWALGAPKDELMVLTVNVEALGRMDKVYQLVKDVLKRRPTMLAVDESQIIASPGVKQTKRALFLSPLATHRLLLTGTPMTESPFQLYSQFKFLSPTILGFSTFAAFKQRYGEWSEGYSYHQGRSFPKLERYRNLEELTAKVEPYSFRFRRDQFSDDVPEMVYQKERFELTERQRRAYEQLASEFRLELSDGRSVSASLVLTRWLRLQQVTSNYWPASTEVVWHEACEGAGCADCEGLGIFERDVPIARIDPNRNPRLEAAARVLESEPGQAIVWARFRQDLTDLAGYAREAGVSYVRYDGTVSATEQERAYRAFKAGDARWILANPAAMGRGRDLREAKLLLFYSNSFSLEQRLQAEARGESLLATEHTSIVDLVADDTKDDDIVAAMRAKRSLSAMVMGDPEKEWI